MICCTYMGNKRERNVETETERRVIGRVRYVEILKDTQRKKERKKERETER